MRCKTALALALLATLTSGCVVKFDKTKTGVSPKLVSFMSIVKKWENQAGRPKRVTVGGCDIDRSGLGTDTAYKGVTFVYELKGVLGRADGQGKGTFALTHPMYGTFKGDVERVRCVGEARTFLLEGRLLTGEKIVMQTYPIDEMTDGMQFEIVRDVDTPHFVMVGNIPSAYYQKPHARTGVVAVRD